RSLPPAAGGWGGQRRCPSERQASRRGGPSGRSIPRRPPAGSDDSSEEFSDGDRDREADPRGRSLAGGGGRSVPGANRRNRAGAPRVGPPGHQGRPQGGPGAGG